MNGEITAIAAANLADWHDLSFRALDCPSSREPFLWWGDTPAPPQYYTGITLESGDFAAEQLASVRNRAGTRSGQEITVCDSFGTLDLAAAGFAVVQEDDWLVREPGEPQRGPFPRGLAIRRVVTPELLEEWEDARRVAGDVGPFPGREPAAGGLDVGEPRLQVFAGSVGERVVAGSVALIGERAVGIYGVWTDPAFRRQGIGEWMAWRAVLGRPQLPAILQPSPESSALFRRMGFVGMGRFRVWQRLPAARA